MSREEAALAILHDINMIPRFFDDVLTLHRGELSSAAPPNEMLSASLLAQLFGVSFLQGEVSSIPVWIVDGDEH